MVFNSPALKMMRLLNTIPGEISSIAGVKIDTFKRKLNMWLLSIIDSYKAAAENNTFVHQSMQGNN